MLLLLMAFKFYSTIKVNACFWTSGEQSYTGSSVLLKSGCYHHIRLLTFCLLFQEFQTLSTSCQLLGVFSHSEPADKNKQDTSIFKAHPNNLQTCIQQRWPGTDSWHILPLEVTAHWLNKQNYGNLRSHCSVSASSSHQHAIEFTVLYLLSTASEKLLNNGQVLLNLHHQSKALSLFIKTGLAPLLKGFIHNPSDPKPNLSLLWENTNMSGTPQRKEWSHTLFSWIQMNPRKKGHHSRDDFLPQLSNHMS